MSVLVLLLVRGQQCSRFLLTAVCAGLVAVLLLLTVAILRLPDQVEEYLFPLLGQPGLRPGVVLTLVLLTSPVLLLLYQLLRLGTTARQRRFGVLRIVGATPTQIRLMSAAELMVPALLGAAVVGPLGYALLRLLFGGANASGVGRDPLRLRAGFVPTTVTPTPVEALLVVVLVGLLCGLIGWVVSRDVVTSAYVLTRRAVPRQPQPWPLLLLLAAFALTLLLQANAIVLVVGIGVAALALLLSGPWVAAQAGRRAARRADTAAALLAGRRVIADPWAAGRAVAPIAVVGLVSAGAAAVLVDLLVYGNFEGFYVISLGLVVVALLVVLSFVVFALAAHSVEGLSEHRRSTAALAAAGASLDVLHRALVLEARLLARPAAMLGLIIGTLAILVVTYPWGEGDSSPVALIATALAAGLLLLGLSEVAARTAARLVRPWLRSAASPEALRTE